MSTPSNREETLFEQALGIVSPAARDAYLRDACGADAGLRERIQGLLAAHHRAGKFLEHRESQAGVRPSPAAAALGVPSRHLRDGQGDEPAEAGTPNPAPICAPSEKPGDRIGRYKLLDQIGEGGMGTVWMAEQEERQRSEVSQKTEPPYVGCYRRRRNSSARFAAISTGS